MAIDTLTAKANVGAGTDTLAGLTTPGGFAGAIVTTDGTNTQQVATEATLSVIASAIRAEDTAHVSGDVGVMALAVRADAETTLAIPDGDYSPLQVNSAGRLKVSTQPGLYSLVTGSITANAQTVFCQVDRASNVMLHMVATSLVGHNSTFEGSIDSTNGTDGNWFAIQAVRSNANTIETTTGVLAATPAYAWEASVNGLSFIRVRATAHTSGTALWKIQRGSYATEPIPAAQISGTQPVSGTVTANQGTFTAPTASNVNSAASTNGTVVKASAGTVYSVTASNINAAVRYLKFYNSTTVTVGTTTPIITIPIPAGGVVNVPFGTTGHRFTTGICLGITTGAADNDTGAVAAGEIKVTTSFI
jgi:hypothetical protein